MRGKPTQAKSTPARPGRWRVSLIRKRSQYLGYLSARYLGSVIAEDQDTAEAAAVKIFNLDIEQRARLVVQKRR